MLHHKISNELIISLGMNLENFSEKIAKYLEKPIHPKFQGPFWFQIEPYSVDGASCYINFKFNDGILIKVEYSMIE